MADICLGFIWPGRESADLVRPEPQRVELIRGGPAAPELAQRPIDYVADRHPRRAFAELKVDGYRCLYIDGRLVTLEGQPFNAALHCLPALREIERLAGEPIMLDAEYLEPEGYDATASAFRKGQGQGVLWLFDIVPLSEWMTNTNAEPWFARKAYLKQLVHEVRSPFAGVLYENAVPTETDAIALFRDVRRQGLEGIVVKDADAPYRRNRDGAWLRMKPCDTIDLALLDILGDDKRGCRRIICRDDAGPVTLTAGWSREQAATIWRHRNALVGCYVEVEHTGRTEQGKLRHPRFFRMREDRLPAERED